METRMNTYLYVVVPLLIICIIGAIVALTTRPSPIICPNCSAKRTFADQDRVGLCKKCATSHEFVDFRLLNGTQFGIVCLKGQHENHPSGILRA